MRPIAELIFLSVVHGGSPSGTRIENCSYPNDGVDRLSRFGETTLLNRIPMANHGKHIALIENEFSEIGIAQELIIGAETAFRDATSSSVSICDDAVKAGRC